MSGDPTRGSYSQGDLNATSVEHSTGMGHACPTCGWWIAPGAAHVCAPVVQPAWPFTLAAMLVALERIAAALERLSDK